MIDQIVECIISRPQEFTLAGRTFAIYPESLGVSLLLVCHYKRLGLRNDGRVAASMEALMLCKQQRNEVAEIIALSTASGKDEALDPQWMQERAKFLTKHLSDDEMAALLIVILSMPRADALIKDIGLDREQEEKRRIAKASGDNSVAFGGRADIACQSSDDACRRHCVNVRVGRNPKESSYTTTRRGIHIGREYRYRYSAKNDGGINHERTAFCCNGG